LQHPHGAITGGVRNLGSGDGSPLVGSRGEAMVGFWVTKIPPEAGELCRQTLFTDF